MNTHTIAALVERRRELAGQLEKAQGHVQQLHADLASLDALIRQFDPDYNVGAIRPKYRRKPNAAEFGSYEPGRAGRSADGRRAAGGQGDRGQDHCRAGAERRRPGAGAQYEKRVDMALRYQRTNGMVVAMEVDKGEVAWMIQSR